MTARIAVLAYAVLCGYAVAEPAKYAVDGLVLGTELNFESASYGEYRCSPSNQFDGFTWCQKTQIARFDTAIYSLLHSREGSILYINRSQELAFLNAKKAEESIQQSSSKLGELPRVIKMPHRRGFPDGVIAVWGKVTLEQLDQESIKVLADRKGLKKGLLIDFLGNFVRSAKAGLPVYRIDGGPGFVWAASFDQKGRGILRLGAVDASKFLLPSEGQQPTVQMSEAESEASEAKPELRQGNEEVQPELTDATAVIVAPENKAAAERAETEDPTVGTDEKVQTELTDATATIVDPENKAAAERTQIEDARVKTNEKVQPELTDATATIVDAENKAAPERTQTEDARVGTNEKVQPELTDATATIVDPENKAAAERAQTEDARVRTNEKVKPELTDAAPAIVDHPENKAVAESVQAEDARKITESATLDAVRAPLEAKRAIGDANTNWWEAVAYGSIVGLLVALTVSAVVFYRKRQKASASKGPVFLHRTDLIEATAKPAIGNALSPEEALDKIEAIRRSLLQHLTSSPSLAPSPRFSSKGAIQTDAASTVRSHDRLASWSPAAGSRERIVAMDLVLLK